MKKILIFLLVGILALSLFVSCSKPEEKVEEQPEVEDYSDYFLNPRSEAELCYLSYFGCDDFGSYIMAYPDVAIEHIAKGEGMDYDTFAEKIEAQCDKLGESRLAIYEKEFDVGYNSILDEKIEGDELVSLKERLSEYGIENIKEAIRGHYSYACFTRQERIVNEDGTTENNFGTIPDNAEILYQSTAVFTIINIDGEGWYVSPEDFIAE